MNGIEQSSKRQKRRRFKDRRIHTAEYLLSLTADERKALRIDRKPTTYKKEERTKLTSDGLLEYLRQHDFRTSRGLEAGRSKGDPAVYDYRKTFGSWSEAVRLSFGSPIKASVDATYIARLIIIRGLWTARKYMAARVQSLAERKKVPLMPDDVPPLTIVLREFGSWKKAKVVAGRLYVKGAFVAYVSLYNDLGRIPYADECALRNIDISRLVKIWDGKSNLDEAVRKLAEISRHEG